MFDNTTDQQTQEQSLETSRLSSYNFLLLRVVRFHADTVSSFSRANETFVCLFGCCSKWWRSLGIWRSVHLLFFLLQLWMRGLFGGGLQAFFLRARCSWWGEDNSSNESVKGEGLSENHHKNNSNHDISLGVSTDSSVSNNTNAKSRGERWETTAKTSWKVLVGLEVVDVPTACCLDCVVSVGDWFDYFT